MFLLMFVWYLLVYVCVSVCDMYAYTCMMCARVHLYGLLMGIHVNMCDLYVHALGARVYPAGKVGCIDRKVCVLA